jgi:hypothetical protein
LLPKIETGEPGVTFAPTVSSAAAVAAKSDTAAKHEHTNQPRV